MVKAGPAIVFSGKMRRSSGGSVTTHATGPHDNMHNPVVALLQPQAEGVLLIFCHDKTPPPSWTNVLLPYESPLVIDRAYRRPTISW